MCRQRHHLAQHIPVMDVFGIQVGFIQDINTRKCDARIINNRFGECHEPGDIHSVIWGQIRELGGAFQDGGGRRRGGGGGGGGGPDFRKTQIVFLNNKPPALHFISIHNR